jgi:hypothetical protein
MLLDVLLFGAFIVGLVIVGILLTLLGVGLERLIRGPRAASDDFTYWEPDPNDHRYDKVRHIRPRYWQGGSGWLGYLGWGDGGQASPPDSSSAGSHGGHGGMGDGGGDVGGGGGHGGGGG